MPPSIVKDRSSDKDTIYFLGIDCSVRSTGIYLTSIGRAKEESFLIRPPKKLREGDCLKYIFQHINTIIKGKNIKSAVMEGPAFSAVNKSYSMGEAYGVFKLVLSLRGVPLTLVPPSTLKRYFSGKGQCTKATMLRTANTLGYNGSSEDIADGMACALLALDLSQDTNSIGKRSSLEVIQSLTCS